MMGMVAGNAQESPVYNVLARGETPPGNKLNQAQSDLIYKWIPESALNS
jgi:hypothetical protein